MLKRCVKLQRNLNSLSPIAFNSSTFSKNGREEVVVASEDGNIIVAWHPAPEFPYKCTQPLPSTQEHEGPLKHVLDDKMKSVTRKSHPYFEIKKLQEITFTNKHIWYPRPERKLIKFKEKEPRDREYL